MCIYIIYNIGRNMSTQLALKHREDPLLPCLFSSYLQPPYSQTIQCYRTKNRLLSSIEVRTSIERWQTNA